MPKLDSKAVFKELDQGIVWPFYWIYGSERFKSRELLNKIKKTVLEVGEGTPVVSALSWNEQVFEGNETTAEEILDAAQSLALGGGVRLIIVRDSHSLKNPDLLVELVGPAVRKADLTSVCVFLSKDLDGRKKFSKQILEKAAVLACEEVPENQKEAWIQYLAKRQSVDLTPTLLIKLCALDPWSLDGVDQELQKFSIGGFDPEVVLEGGGAQGADTFVENFFSRDLKKALPQVIYFAERPDESLPLLGLFGWNLRHLSLYLAHHMGERNSGTRSLKLNPFLMERLKKWALNWTLSDLITLQNSLVELDQMLKLSPLLPLGVWNQWVIRFCK